MNIPVANVGVRRSNISCLLPVVIPASLFQPFTTAGKSNGLGLGLALSRQTMPGGNLTLEPFEVGATFRVSLPAAARRAAA